MDHPRAITAAMVILKKWLSQGSPSPCRPVDHTGTERIVKFSENLTGRDNDLSTLTGHGQRALAPRIDRQGSQAAQGPVRVLRPEGQPRARPIAMNFSRRSRTIVARSRPCRSA